MNVLLLNSILRTAQNGVIPAADSIKDCMIYNLGLGFLSSGHTVTLVAASEYKPSAPEEYDFEVVFLPSAFKRLLPPAVLPLQPALWRFLKSNRERFDLVISSEVFAFPSLFASILAPRKTLVWHELALHTHKFKSIPSYFWYYVVAKIFMRSIPVVARSDAAKQFISRYMPRTLPDTIEHGVNLSRFECSAVKQRQFIVVSQLIPRKNIAGIIGKFARFVQTYNDFRLLIVGRGELEEALRRQVGELQISDNVEFCGFKAHHELHPLLASSMALLIDTRQDNNMVSIPEAIACGTPVVTNRIPTNSYIIGDNALGVADEWDEHTLQQVVDNNGFYVNNCLAYRDRLSTQTVARRLLSAVPTNK